MADSHPVPVSEELMPGTASVPKFNSKPSRHSAIPRMYNAGEAPGMYARKSV
jgi:hypothetical protein